MHTVFGVAQGECTLLHGGLQLHASLGQLGQGLTGLSGHSPYLKFVHAAELAFNAAPPNFSGMVKAVNHDGICFLAGLV